MDKLQSYRDICEEIELWEVRLWDLEGQMRIIMKQFITPPRMKMVASYSGMPHSGMLEINLPRSWNEMRKIESKILECKDVLSLKIEAKMRMEKRMSGFEGLEFKVAYMRDVEKKPLYKIAEELGYTYQWIRSISAKTKRVKPTKNQQTA
jgi:hypothetical protein